MTTTTAIDTTSNPALTAYLANQSSTVAADAASAANSTSTSSTSAASVQASYNEFLHLLTTQLQHQDPTDASDPNQFTQELVQFSQVEQQLSTNSDLSTLISLQKASSGTTAALGYVGKYVEAATSNNQIVLQNGTAELGYSLPSATQSVTVSVLDSSGNTIRTYSGGTSTTGVNYVAWDGKNSSGTQMTDGTYKFSISATDTSGNTETITDLRTLALVTGVTSNSDGTTNLQMGDTLSVLQSSIDAVYGSGSLPASTATDSADTSS